MKIQIYHLETFSKVLK